MTLADQHMTPPAWSEPAGLNPRGTVLVIPAEESSRPLPLPSSSVPGHDPVPRGPVSGPSRGQMPVN
jgi:hypothetical protein